MQHDFPSLLVETLTFIGIFTAGYIAAAIVASIINKDAGDK